MFQLGLILISIYVLFRWLSSKPSNFPPGPPKLPFIGSIPFLKSKNIHIFFNNVQKKYGPVIGFYVGMKPAIAVCGTKEVLEVLKREEFQDRPEIPLPPGIMFANGDFWKDQRRFTIRHLRDFGYGKSTINDMVAEEMEDFSTHKLADQRIVQASGLFNMSAINILWALVAGSRLSYGDSASSTLLDNLQKLFRAGNPAGALVDRIPYMRKTISLFYELADDRIEKKLKAYFQKTIDDHRATKSEVARDFIDVYLDELSDPTKKDSFSETTLIYVVRDLFAAGTESSSNTVSFCLMYLVLYPEWQDRIAKEIEENIGGRSPTYEDRNILPQVEAFIAEVQRCNTIAPVTVPHYTSKETTLNGHTVPNKTVVVVNLWSVLQDKQHWKDPENFRPDRFLSSDGKFVRDPMMIIFGIGPRICLGETLARSFAFMFLVSLIQKYRFSTPPGHEKPNTLCESGFTTAPKPFFVQLEKRQ